MTYLSPVFEAIAAKNRTIVPGLEGYLAGLAALGADGVKHLTISAAVAAAAALAGLSAVFAALRFVGESLFGVELLLAGSKGELLSAVLADDGFVAVHEIPLKCNCAVQICTAQ